jgi:hypothetical protein
VDEARDGESAVRTVSMGNYRFNTGRFETPARNYFGKSAPNIIITGRGANNWDSGQIGPIGLGHNQLILCDLY